MVKNESLYGKNSFSISSGQISKRKKQENRDDLFSQGDFTISDISI